MKLFAALLLLLLSTIGAQAQVCNGSLGDPIKNFDFSSGSGTFGPRLDNGITNYNYVANSPEDGSYTIANTTANMNGGWWSTTDHTGNSGGYMMVVNASFSTGTFYTQIVNDLCPGTTYEFAAWVLNLSNRIQIEPNITFTIQTSAGSKTYNTGNIPANTSAAVWKQYGLLFTMPATGGDVTITMSNNAPGGIGNDIALDDITFRPCGPLLQPSFGTSGNSSAEINVCAGTNQSYTMGVQPVTEYQNPVYQWQIYNGSTWVDIPGEITNTYTANFTPTDAGHYRYRVASAEANNIASVKCRVVSSELTINLNQPPSSNIKTNAPVCEGETLTLNASAGDSYNWTGPNGFTSNQQSPEIPNATNAAAGTYHVVVIRAGCSTPASVPVVINPKVVATAGPEATICSGSNTTLQASGGTKYHWVPATGLSDADSPNPIASPAITTTYTVTVSNDYGCSATATQKVNVTPRPTADAGADQKISEGQSVTLNGTATGTNISYYWTPSDYLSNPNILNPVATPKNDITYTLHVVNSNCGFDIPDPVFIRVFKSVAVPNTFTPNNDGINDTWNMEALETYPESTTQVFNRYGEVVMQSKGYSKPWDGNTNGKPLPAGTYYYKIDLKNGKVLSGWVSIVR